MPRPPSSNDDRFLRLVHQLRLADLEMLIPLLSDQKDGKPTFGLKGIERASERLFEQGHLYRLWKFRDPKSRFDRGSRRKVFLLSPEGAKRIGLSPEEIKHSVTRWKTMKDPRTEHRLEHELMISRFHASLLVAERHSPDILMLDGWEQERDVISIRKNQDDKQPMLVPDAMFRLTSQATKKRGWFFLEADTGNERLESNDNSRRTIDKKVRRYGEIDRKDIATTQFGLSGFSVLFVVPRRADPGSLSGRERGVLDMIRRHGQLDTHAPRFYRVMSETEVELALHAPTHFFTTATIRRMNPEGETVTEYLIAPPALHEPEASRYTQPAEPIA